MNEYKNRLECLINQLPEEVDGALVTSQINRFYLTGYSADTGFLLAAKKGTIFITDFRYIEAAQEALKDVCQAVVYSDFPSVLTSYCNAFSASSLLLENEHLTLHEAGQLIKASDPVRLFTTEHLDLILNSMRLSKSLSELEYIRAAQAVTESSYRHILTCVREGVTERELALELEFHMRRSGASRVSFDLIVAAGANGSKPHAVPTDYRIKKGDFITFDIGAVVNEYHSDMTRTVALGDVTDEQRRIYDIVLSAQRAAIDYIVSGGHNCREADMAARDIITNAGYGDCFGHSTGHGVGLEVHELPSLAPKSGSDLCDGCIVTVEPGVYLPGRFGVRIEDMLYITESSAINLTGAEKELITI